MYAVHVYGLPVCGLHGRPLYRPIIDCLSNTSLALIIDMSIIYVCEQVWMLSFAQVDEISEQIPEVRKHLEEVRGHYNGEIVL